MMATIPDSLLVLDRDLRIKSASRSFYKLFQTRPREVIGSKITDILGDEDGKLSAELTKLFGTKDTLENFELHYQAEKLGKRIFNVIAKEIIVAEQQLVVIQDITERKQAAEALQQEKAYSESIMASVPDMLLTLNSKGGIKHVNDAMAKFAGAILSLFNFVFSFDFGHFGSPSPPKLL